MGLIEHYWYCWLDRLCVGRTMTTVLKKVAIDQLICGPGIGLWYFIGEKDSRHGSKQMLSECLMHICIRCRHGSDGRTQCERRLHGV